MSPPLSRGALGSGHSPQAFRACGFASNRARFIPGRALDVLPRLADAGYDLVFCDGDRLEFLDYLAESLRLLRPGGLANQKAPRIQAILAELAASPHGLDLEWLAGLKTDRAMALLTALPGVGAEVVGIVEVDIGQARSLRRPFRELEGRRFATAHRPENFRFRREGIQAGGEPMRFVHNVTS